MKRMRMLKQPAILAIILAATTFGGLPAKAQQILAGWLCNSLPASGGTTPIAPTTSNPNLTIGALAKGAGIGAVTTTGIFGGNTWTNAVVADSEASSISHGLYLTYSVTPNAGYTVSFTTNILYYHNSATGPWTGELQFSTDGINYADVAPLAYSTAPNPAGVAETAWLTNNLSGISALQNIHSGTTAYFRIVNWGAYGTAGTWYIDSISGGTTPDFQVIGAVTSAGVAPNNLTVTPASVTTNAGSTVVFTALADGDPASNFWYQATSGAPNLIATGNTGTLTLPNVLAGNSGGYFVVFSNKTGSATSSVVNLTVTGDPAILTEPSSTFGLLNGTVQFSVTTAATTPGYQWYFADTSGDLIAPVSNGVQPSGSVVSGATFSSLTFTNLQATYPTNFVVVVTNIYGTATSSVASLLSVGTSAILAYWDFNGAALNLSPYWGSGTVTNFNCTTESGAADIDDGYGFNVESLSNPSVDTTNFSWATLNYPLSGGNKESGVQFNVSTLGAKNITISYASRVSATASDYERLQYTTNGSTWTDYPTSSTFGGVSGASGVGNNYLAFSYNLTGFPGVDNNPNFGIRVVAEFQSTATYGIGVNGVLTNNYVGTANTYGTAGTVTYDQVTFNGDSITNALTAPSISSFTDTNLVDTNNISLAFTVGDADTALTNLSVRAVSLIPSVVNPAFTFSGTGASRTLNISFPPGSYIPNAIDAAPILVTVADTNGDATATWFLLTVTSLNLPPTNSLVALVSTNTLVNTPLTIPFSVGDDRTPVSGLTYNTSSADNTLIPSANVVVGNQGTANPMLTITPAAYQVGVARVSVGVNDNDVDEPRTTTANLPVMVRPNTNVVLVDYFDYDNGGGPLDSVSAGYWTHLSGTTGQLIAGNGVAVVDTLNNRENVQAQLLGAPYTTNSGATLYASFTINMNPRSLPVANGTYFALFNDGSGTTGPYEGRVVAATNNAAPGFYRIGINNFGADATTGAQFPLDLVPGTNYVVVEALELTNGFSTVWINPNGPSSQSVTDTTPAPAATNLYNIADFELRESGDNAGAISLGSLKVGTTFDSVLPSLHINVAGPNVVLNWSDPTLGVQYSTNLAGPYVDIVGATPPYTNSVSTNNALFYRFGQ